MKSGWNITVRLEACSPLKSYFTKRLIERRLETFKNSTVSTILSSKKREMDMSLEESDEQLLILKQREEKYWAEAQQTYSF